MRRGPAGQAATLTFTDLSCGSQLVGCVEYARTTIFHEFGSLSDQRANWHSRHAHIIARLDLASGGHFGIDAEI